MMSDKLKKIFETDEHGLLNVPKRAKAQSSSDRLESSFLEINDFYTEHSKEPDARTTNMAERKLGVRLRAIRIDDTKVDLLKHLDTHNLLTPEDPPESFEEVFKDDALGLFDDPTGILTLNNVPNTTQRSEPESVASRMKAKGFDKYEPLFQQQHERLLSGVVKLGKFTGSDTVNRGKFFVLNGLMLYVEDIGEKTIVHGRPKERIHCIFENGTESYMYLRSLASQLYEDGGYEVVLTDYNGISTEDVHGGYIYVLSSLSDDPAVANVKDLYKIGFSTTTVEERTKNAPSDPTYLMAPVRVVATYKSFNMNTQKFEALLHRVLFEVRLDMDMINANGRHYAPGEWFVAPLDVIDMAIRMIVSGDIVNYRYDANSKSLISLDD